MLVNRKSSKFELRLIQIKFVFVDLIMVTVLRKDERVRDLLAGGYSFARFFYSILNSVGKYF